MKRFLATIVVISLTTIPTLTVKVPAVNAQQPCPSGQFVPPSSETRVYRNQRLGFSFELPANYRAMAFSTGRIDVLDPAAYEWTSCVLRNREATEFKLSPVAVEVKPVNPGRRSLETIVRTSYPWVNTTFSPRRVSNQSGITASYNEILGGERVTDVYFLTPNKRNLVRVSGPAQGEVLNLALSTFAFK